MELVNETRFQTGWTVGFARDGRELLIVAVKGTFSVPEPGEECQIADQQIPLVEADTFTGEPGVSAVLEEVDYAHHKPACDVLLNASACAPRGRPAQRVNVSLQVGNIHKTFDVVGNRRWERGLVQTLRVSDPEPFVTMPITYDRAFGGVDKDPEEPDKVATYVKNPVGVGYYPLARDGRLEGRPLPNTEERGRPATTRDGTFEPMSFGPIGRNFAVRYPLAGTYDQQWLDNQAPFWPDDFNYAYFQAAPRDQQMPYPTGGETVVLQNLTSDGFASWRLPVQPMPLAIIHRNKAPEVRQGVIDTLVIHGDVRLFSMTWRTTVPLRRDCFEIAQVIAGRESVRPAGPPTAEKPRFKSLSAFVEWKRRHRL